MLSLTEDVVQSRGGEHSHPAERSVKFVDRPNRIHPRVRLGDPPSAHQARRAIVTLSGVYLHPRDLRTRIMNCGSFITFLYLEGF